MAFLQEELRNLSFKAVVAGILGTRNRSTAPDNGTYYEEIATTSLSVNPNQVLLNIADVPAAENKSDAEDAANNNPQLIKSYNSSNAIHLTPLPGNKAFFATSTYNDLGTRLTNFIMPQMVPLSDGRPSIGYGARLYNGNPASGGTEITTTAEQVGADVGWVVSYGPGAIITASSFASIDDPTDVWMTAYQYVGPVLGQEPLDAGLKDTRYFEFKAGKISPKNLLWVHSDIYNDPSLIRVYLNGTLLAEGTDYSLNTQMEKTNHTYVQHLEFPNASSYNSDDIISITYTEKIIQNGPQISLGLKENFDNDTRIKINSKSIPITSNITDSSSPPPPRNCYLSGANIISENEVDITYTDFHDSSYNYTVKKRYPNAAKISEFGHNEYLQDIYPGIDIYVEIWARTRNKSGLNSSTLTRSHDAQNKITYIKSTPRNVIPLDSWSINVTSDLHIRLRYHDHSTNKLLGFSDFCNSKIKTKKINIFTTDASLSNKNYVGFVLSTRVI